MRDVAESKSSFNRALRFFDNGDLSTAETICREALKEFPAEGKLQCLLGTILVRQQRSAEAAATLIKTDAANRAHGSCWRCRLRATEA